MDAMVGLGRPLRFLRELLPCHDSMLRGTVVNDIIPSVQYIPQLQTPTEGRSGGEATNWKRLVCCVCTVPQMIYNDTVQNNMMHGVLKNEQKRNDPSQNRA